MHLNLQEARQQEAQRQQAVLAACATAVKPAEPFDEQQPCWSALVAARLRTDAAGLRAYQVNANATARRVLSRVYPAMRAMVGQDALDALAALLWRQSPPACADLNEWGADLPDLLASHPDLQAWPWLSDCARLEWARHACERALDAACDVDSLQHLGDTPPDRLRLQLKPCVHIVCSPWPIAALWSAHQGDEAQHAQAAAQALQGSGEAVVVWRRRAWQAEMAVVPPDQAQWMHALINAERCADGSAEDGTLGNQLDHAPHGFDFASWLQQAVGQGWLWRVSVQPLRSPSA